MSRLNSLATALAVFLAAAPLAAQGVTQTEPSAPAAPVTTVAPEAAPAPIAESGLSLAPVARNQSVGVRMNAAQSANGASPLMPAQMQSSHSVAMMIVGGAALIVGAVITGQAGTIVMIVGAVVGLIGLWNYLQ